MYRRRGEAVVVQARVSSVLVVTVIRGWYVHGRVYRRRRYFDVIA